jgi:hypothetical protein
MATFEAIVIDKGESGQKVGPADFDEKANLRTATSQSMSNGRRSITRLGEIRWMPTRCDIRTVCIAYRRWPNLALVASPQNRVP